jgi:hypothetical protein
MRVRCDAGWRLTNMVGDLPGYGTVWYNPRSIANILHLSKVKQKYLVRDPSVVTDAQSGQSAEKTLQWKPEVLTILRLDKEKE